MIKISENTTVIVSKDTRDSLKALGRKGESYDSIIRSLVEDSRLYREVLGEGGTGR